MQEYIIKSEIGSSRILVGESLENVMKYLPHRSVIIITDENVSRLYRDKFPGFPVITIGTGEKIKTIDTVGEITDEFIRLGVDRGSFILGIGGGLVCDITGFAASIFMRGLGFGYVSTTLLSQVDASVGGKTGVNYRGYKNMLGSFRQPEFVLCNPDMLKTLPEQDYRSGFAEIVKHGVIKDRELFDYLSSHLDEIKNREMAFLSKIVSDSIKIKAGVVRKDPTEHGYRRILNFGHTFGHAIESVFGLTHGESVSLGMIIASDISVKKGLLIKKEAGQIKKLLSDMGLVDHTKHDYARLASAIGKDKKKKKDLIHFVYITSIGVTKIIPVPVEELKTFIRDYKMIID
ncbi:MAG: 3-dehydroquinate synthase [Bacteroidetes bacterium]|nr:3-dehydroquinate synthase [Bacteroidota bacterium]